MVTWVSGNILGAENHKICLCTTSQKIKTLYCKYWSRTWQRITTFKSFEVSPYFFVVCREINFVIKLIDTMTTSDGKYSRKLQDCNHLHLVEHNLQDYYCILLISSRWDRKVSIKNSYFHCQHTLEQYSILYHSPVTSNDLLSVLSHQVQWLDGENMWMLLWVLFISRKKV